MSKKTIQLEEEVGQLKADLSAALDELSDIKQSAAAEVTEEKKKLLEAALETDAKRQEDLSKAKAGFFAILKRAKEIYRNIESQDPKLLGIAGQTAREGQLTILREIFGNKV